MRVAIIGSGVSGIGAAKVFKQRGFDVTIFERSDWIGGVWSVGYQDLHLQSHAAQYCFSDFPWPEKPSRHPTGREVLEYLNLAIAFYGLTVKLRHEVISMEERVDGWLICVRNRFETRLYFYDYVVICSGLHTDGIYRPSIPGEENFSGEIYTEREIESPDQFAGKKVVVVGFGKAALDMASMSAERSERTIHLFRQPRWTLPDRLLGIDFSYYLFSRLGTFMMTSWVQPGEVAKFIHQYTTLVRIFWTVVGWFLQLHIIWFGLFTSPEGRKRIKATIPKDPLLHDKKFVVAVLPRKYYPLVASGAIEPIQDQLTEFTETGIRLRTGKEIQCDMVVLSLGNQTPAFPYLPDRCRWLMEREGGAQLYRHLLHPRIPRLGFIGFNHCYMHLNAVEIGALWLSAVWREDLKLPSVEDMEESSKQVSNWKKVNMAFEPTRSYLVLTRYQQYLDMLLLDLGVSPYRKLPNIFAELFCRYESSDYKDVMDEHETNLALADSNKFPDNVKTT